MKVLTIVLWLHLLVSVCLGAPTPSPLFDAVTNKPSSPREPVTFSDLGRDLVNIGVGIIGLILGLGAAESVLHISSMLKTHKAERIQNEVRRQAKADRVRDAEIREEEALQLLLEIAEKHAQRLSAEGFDKKLEPFVVPKEIHLALERIFLKDGGSNVGAYRNLKDTLAPLVSFEK
jgi:hypothetical protein